MNIECRPITTSDTGDIARLSGQLGYAISAEDTANNITYIMNSANDIGHVAITNGTIVGWIHVFYTLRLESAPYCEIAGLVVDADHRSKGIGKMLINATRDWCITRGVTGLRVRCNVKRTDAHRFYINAGFKENKEQKVFEAML